MDFLKNLLSGAQSTWNNLFNRQKPVISPLQDNQSQGFIGPMAPGTPGGAGFIGPVKPGTPDIRFPQSQGTFQQPSSNQSGLDPHINPATGVWDDNYFAQQQQGGGNPADSILQALVNPLQAEIESWWKRLDEYDKNNPFAFDEALARASSEERLNPYFNATMNEFMTGIRRSSQRSVEDMTRTIGELNVDASKLSEKERFNTQEAIRSSEEGFAGAGLFFSGKRERASGVEEVGGMQKQEDIATTLGRGVASQTRGNIRLQEDLALQTARQNRLLGAERTTALETDISKQKRESELQRGLERLQFAGKIPGASPSDQLTLENQFLSGLT